MRAFNSVLSAIALSMVAVTATASGLPSARPESVGMSSERLARMDRIVHGWVDAARTPGVVTVIFRHGKIVHVDAYGKADVATGRPTRADDLFRMYSMTKPITSVALLMLYEEGKFQLTDPLAKYFPAVAEMRVYAGTGASGRLMLDAQKQPITIRHIMSHTAGFSYGFGGTPIDRLYQEANLFASGLDDLMAKLVKLPLVYQPGERWQYSVAHDVQAALVEKLSGQKFDDFVRQRILVPLGLKDTVFKVSPQLRPRVPALYGQGADGRIVADTSALGQNYGDLAFGGYSISATAQDYATFAQLLLNKGEWNGVRLLSPKTVELMTSNHLSDQAMTTINTPPVVLGQGAGYGLGVSVLLDPAKHGNLGSAGEFGWSGAASTHVLIDPKEDLVAVFCTQLMGDYALRSEFVTAMYQAIVGR